MYTMLNRTLTLAALFTFVTVPFATAMDHSSMGHGSPGAAGMHGAAPPAGAAAQPARHGIEIRKAVVFGHTLAYNLIDMKQMMASSSMPMTHGGEKMKSHHLMVYPVGPDGKPATDGKAGYLVVQPDKAETKAMAMLMEDGFGADLDLVAKGDYRITTKIALGGTTLVDEFVYTVK